MDKQESSGSKTVERAGVGFLERPGVVVTDRHAVPQPLGDVEVTFNQEVTVQARVLFIHPEHNLVLLQVPPLPEELHTVAWLHAKPDDAGTAHTHLEPGTSLQFVGLDACGHEVVRRVSVASLSLPPPQAAMPSGPPRFAERNCEILDLAEPLPTRWSGLLLHDDGSIAAFYALFACQMPNGTRGTRSGGIPREALLQLMQVDDACKTVPALGVELEEITVAALRHERGFDRLQATVPVEGEANGAAAAQAPPTLSEWKPSRPVVLCVARVEKGGPADGTLREGDVLVRAAGSYVRDGVLALSSRASPGRPLALQVFRSGAVASLELVPSADGSDGAERVAIWHGLVCVHTPRALRRAGGLQRRCRGLSGRVRGARLLWRAWAVHRHECPKLPPRSGRTTDPLLGRSAPRACHALAWRSRCRCACPRRGPYRKGRHANIAARPRFLAIDRAAPPV
mmetsp:Transcript_183358/g.581489  ORF Transcript_183358/g.581489 Transcript_183358/m.581489 type:complete len:455 (+) Transcript_183358:612-1976(+)